MSDIEAPSLMPAYGEFGRPARQYLEEFGIKTSITPPVRSSDLSLALKDEFLYYLTRRLALMPAFSAPSKALSRGSWMHTYLEDIHLNPLARDTKYQGKIKARQDEVRAICKSIGWESDKLQNALDETSLDANCAYAWLLALNQTTTPTMPKGLFEWLTPINGTRILGTEVSLELPFSFNGVRGRLTMIADRIEYNEVTNTISILDYKSTDSPPTIRAATCPLSFQFLHYRYIVEELLKLGILQNMYFLPADVKWGGFKHVILQKARIVYGNLDRRYHYFSEGKRTGINGSCVITANGQWIAQYTGPNTDSKHPPTNEEEAVKTLHAATGKKPERVYEGEPSPVLYAKRCFDWYEGKGEYEDRKKDPLFQPPINVSTLSGPLDDRERRWYDAHLQRLLELATREPDPINFPSSGEGMTTYGGKLTIYAPLFSLPVAQWPEYLVRHHFIQNPELVDQGDEGASV